MFIEPGLVALLRTFDGATRNVMTVSWAMVLDFAGRLAVIHSRLFNAEVIWRKRPWHSKEAVELATLEWVDWFNTRRLLE